MEEMKRFLADPCVPGWIKDTAREGLWHDPVDAARWTEALATLMGTIADEVAAQHR